MPSRSVIVRLKLTGQQEFASGMDRAAGATEHLGREAKQTGATMGVSARGLVKWTAASAALYRGYHFIKDSVEETTALARATIGLQRQTGLDTETASAWANMAKTRGIAAAQLNRGMVTLGRNIQANATSDVKARQRVGDLTRAYQQLQSAPVASGKALVAHQQRLDKLAQSITRARTQASGAAATFQQLGLSQADLARMTPEQRLEAVADALKGMQDPMTRAAAGQRLFGRAYLQLSPILLKGAEGIRENIETQRRFGATLTDTSGAKAQIEAQHQYEFAMIGLHNTIGTTLMPAITALALNFTHLLVRAQPVFRWMQRNSKTVLVLAGSLIAAIGAIKTFNFLVKTGQNIVRAATAVQWAWNVALDANPIVAIIIAVGLLVASLVLLYRRNRAFREFVRGLFGDLKDAFFAVVHFVDRLIAKITHLAHLISGPIGSVIHGVTGAVGSVADVAGLAQGGTILRGGQVLVGEQGPELLNLPTGASVSPIVAPAVVARGVSGQQTVVTKVYLDKREIALAVAQVNADRKARR